MAVEFIGEPEILFLDEPTSGLDSFSALLVVSILKKAAMKGQLNLIRYDDYLFFAPTIFRDPGFD